MGRENGGGQKKRTGIELKGNRYALFTQREKSKRSIEGEMS